jgi:hypothetical protein
MNSGEKFLVVFDWVDWDDIIPTMKIICV